MFNIYQHLQCCTFDWYTNSFYNNNGIWKKNLNLFSLGFPKSSTWYKAFCTGDIFQEEILGTGGKAWGEWGMGGIGKIQFFIELVIHIGQGLPQRS